MHESPSDPDLQGWWPDFATLVAQLRLVRRGDAADLLIDAVRAGATGGEILGLVGRTLRTHRSLRRLLGSEGRAAWDSVMKDVNRANPLGRLEEWFHRLTQRLHYS